MIPRPRQSRQMRLQEEYDQAIRQICLILAENGRCRVRVEDQDRAAQLIRAVWAIDPSTEHITHKSRTGRGVITTLTKPPGANPPPVNNRADGPDRTTP